MTIEKALRWESIMPSCRGMDIYELAAKNEDAMEVLATEVRRLRAENETLKALRDELFDRHTSIR